MRAPTNFPAGGEAQYPFIPGPDAGIIEEPITPEPDSGMPPTEDEGYYCVYDYRNGQGGDCYSGEKVQLANRPCSRCKVSNFAV